MNCTLFTPKQEKIFWLLSQNAYTCKQVCSNVDKNNGNTVRLFCYVFFLRTPIVLHLQVVTELFEVALPHRQQSFFTIPDEHGTWFQYTKPLLWMGHTTVRMWCCHIYRCRWRRKKTHVNHCYEFWQCWRRIKSITIRNKQFTEVHTPWCIGWLVQIQKNVFKMATWQLLARIGVYSMYTCTCISFFLNAHYERIMQWKNL